MQSLQTLLSSNTAALHCSSQRFSHHTHSPLATRHHYHIHLSILATSVSLPACL